MPFRVSGKNLDVGDALRDRINDRVVEIVSKYFDGGYSGHATLTLEAEGTASDAYASADQAALHIEKRLRRYHRRLKDHRIERNGSDKGWAASDAASYIIAAPGHDDKV